MFQKASKLKLRFVTERGQISTEDLWDLPLQSLDTLAKILNRGLKESAEESFIVKASKPNELIQLKFDIVKHIIDVRLEAADVAEKEVAVKARKQYLMSLMADKENEALKNMSREDLQKMFDEL